jgi:hypothetical protein
MMLSSFPRKIEIVNCGNMKKLKVEKVLFSQIPHQFQQEAAYRLERSCNTLITK